MATIHSAGRWSRIYDETPLVHVAHHFANIANSPFLIEYLKAVLWLCPVGGHTRAYT